MGHMGTSADDTALDLQAVLIERLKDKGHEIEDYDPRAEGETQKLGIYHPEVAKTVMDAWLESEFAGGSSTKKAAKRDRCYYATAASTARVLA